jgi:peptidoglycan/LPS O-acetylase OafA/YrhL
MKQRRTSVARSDRIDAIQRFRGVAVLLVIALHSIELVKFRHERIGEPLGILSAAHFYDQFGASGVDLFFVISGFVMAHLLERVPNGQWTGFLTARLKRILPLYWLATAAMALLMLALRLPIGPASGGVSVTVWPLPGRAALDEPILVVGWSLAFELAFYAVLVPTIFAPAKLRTQIALLITTCFALAGQLLRPTDNFVALFLNPIWYEFSFGLLLHLWWRQGMSTRFARIAGLASLVALGSGILNWVIPETRPFAIYDGSEALNRAIFWAMPWAGLLAWELSRQGESLIARGLLRVGDASYALYLTHMLVMTSLLWLLPPSILPADVLPFVALGLAIALGIATHDHVERPLLAYLKRKRGSPVRLAV